jgi:uncharacterized protein YndB with AHSA1/START domain
MNKSRFVYVTYIRTSPEKLWQALIQPEFTRQYWFGTWQESGWQPGSAWKLMIPGGRIADSGEVVQIDPPRTLVLKWRKEFQPLIHEEGYSLATFTLEPQADVVKLTVTHEMDRAGSKLIEGVAHGWPPILSSLKSLLETGESLPETREWPKDL